MRIINGVYIALLQILSGIGFNLRRGKWLDYNNTYSYSEFRK